ncbi:MAG: hypothetical protein ACTTK1_06475 [Candidatus Cryptobacteroides sp.]|jgi:hypothetical protein
MMRRKQTYIIPTICVVHLDGRENLADFDLTSQTINEGDAKQGDFFDDDEAQFEERPWGEVSY